MKKIETTQAPAAVGPYSQAIETAETLFVSGQIPLEPTTGRLAAGGIVGQTRQVLNNLSAILGAAGYRREQVVRTEVFLIDLAHVEEFNRLYSEFFSDPVKPARTTVQAAALPKAALIEIACIASKK